MPRVPITDENKVGGDSEKFPSLKLATGERGRIVCLDVQAGADGVRRIAPMREWVHRLEAPKVVDGIATRTTRQTKGGGEVKDWDKEWIGSPICLGDLGILARDATDPSNCPVCRANHEDPSVGYPYPRFAMNIVRYGTRPGGWELAVPFSASVVAWAFPSSRFDKLVDIARDEAPKPTPDATSGDLTLVDIKLGPCEDGNWQRYEIGALSGPPVWRMSSELVQYIRMLWTTPGNRATDDQLSALCGRKVVNRSYLDRDIERVRQQWAIANAQQNGQSAPGVMVPYPQGMQAVAADAAATFAQAAPVVPQAPAAAPAAPNPLAAPGADFLGTPVAVQQAPAAYAAPQVPSAYDVPGAALLQAAAPEMAQQYAALAAAGAPVIPQALVPGQPIPGHPGGMAEFAPQPAAPQYAAPAPVVQPAPQYAPPAAQPSPAAPQATVPPAGPVEATAFDDLMRF